MHLSIGTCEIHVNVRSYVKSINVLNRFFRSLVIKTRNTPSPPEICKEEEEEKATPKLLFMSETEFRILYSS